MQNDQINELDDKNVNKESYLKMYICILDEFPDYMTPTLVAHATLGAHIEFSKIKTDSNLYEDWLTNSYKKVVVRVNQGLYDKIKLIENELITKRDGKYIELVGTYAPLEDSKVDVNEEVALKWLNEGAQPTDTVKSLLSKAGVMEKFHNSKSKKDKK